MAGAQHRTRMALSILLLFYAIVFCPVTVAIAGKAEKQEDYISSFSADRRFVAYEKLRRLWKAVKATILVRAYISHTPGKIFFE